MKNPTYSAKDILELSRTVKPEYDTVKIIFDLIEEEIDLYDEKELVILFQASLILFNKTFLYAIKKRIF